jgi:acetoacetyl-[acyl-carrier protein] synthase
MTPLPVITGFGGISPAGRSSAHRGYSRLVESALAETDRLALIASLKGLSGATTPDEHLLSNTLVRSLESSLFDPQAQRVHRETVLSQANGPDLTVLVPDTLAAKVTSAGQLPSAFDPAALYASRNHPRALQMTVYGASDAINSLGIDWRAIRATVAPDAISVYAGNCMGQLDQGGFGGMLQARLLGRKITSKQLPLGLTEMPADFINAYLLGNLGTTGTSAAACATFLYNLRQGILDIRSGSARVAIVGTSEAPLVPEVFEGFNVMGALGADTKLRALDGLAADAEFDSRRACRPFGDNCGFTLAESSQFAVLMDDSLALELGANILGSVSDVFINADGFKKSIASPGVGNYLTMAKAVASARAIVGERSLGTRCLVQAHGTGTPQNRVSESAILDRIAAEFGIDNWQVSAVKAFVGHSLASSGGDQLMATLGLWQHGIIPGIETVTALADDVSKQHLDFVLRHRHVGTEGIDVALLNSKGFGGNNATATVLAPHITRRLLAARHGAKATDYHQQRNESAQEAAADYDRAASSGDHRILYHFDNNVMDEAALSFSYAQDHTPLAVSVGRDRPSVPLNLSSPYAGLLGEAQ